MSAIAKIHGTSVFNEQERTLAILQARSREEVAKALLEIALQRSRASAGAVLFKQDGRFVPFAMSAWGETAVRTARDRSLHVPLELGALEHAARIPDPVRMSEVVSAFDGTAIDLSVLWIPLRHATETIGLVYLEKDRHGGPCCKQAIEGFRLLAVQAAAALSNLRLAEDLERETCLRQRIEASRDEIYESMLQHQHLGKTGDFRFNVRTGVSTGSRECRRILGLHTETETFDRDCWMRQLHPDDRYRVESEIAATLLVRGPIRMECRIIRDGGVRHIFSEARPELDQNGDLQYRGIVADITERKAAEKIFAETEAELSTASRLASLGELAGSIVHEVNQPLTALSNSAEACRRWLLRDPPQTSEAREAVCQVIREGKRAVGIVSGLEALARGARVNPGYLRLGDVVFEVFNLLRAELEQSSVVVHADIDEALPELRGDGFQLQQVVLNLLRNSIESMRQVYDRPRAIEISCRADGQVDLEKGTARIPLRRGRLRSGELVWFVLTDATDENIANLDGLNYSPILAYGLTGKAAREATIERDGTFVFDKGKVDFSPERKVTAGEAPNFFPPKVAQPGSVGDEDYSPLVHIKNASKDILFNAPMVAFDVSEEKLNEFCKGHADHRLVEDKVVAICPRDGYVTLQLTIGFTFSKPILYLSSEANDPVVATLEGATYTPAMKDLPFALEDASPGESAERIYVFVNGATGLDNPQRQGLDSALFRRARPTQLSRRNPHDQSGLQSHVAAVSS